MVFREVARTIVNESTRASRVKQTDHRCVPQMGNYLAGNAPEPMRAWTMATVFNMHSSGKGWRIEIVAH